MKKAKFDSCCNIALYNSYYRVTKMMCLVVTLLVVFSSILDHSAEAQCYTDSGE